jgi:cytoskeletal protein CcmA (bactofilin family)
MHIDGKVNGNVFPNEMSKSSLSIGENGVVDGNVYAETLMTNGTITGDLYASHAVQLGSSAKITGNVYYHKLEMAMGAEVIGNLVKVTKAAWDAMSVKNSAELDKAPAIEDLNNE